ncbi:FAD binding domain-containing protein [Roseovarius pelagicus]|uniref:FAD binding domain-containing protein n=1 Tax=Roseovarius pelagicus TaxID=2980108 RepID=A0ABY6D6N4_9RHOB|nr:FAD binding domain-containing protein [Roseovarius pelagicus]UXX81807.1 FAD binding domain-containing protein [Roseovarius pelagicus]
MQANGYHRPETLDEALRVLAGGSATIAAGCTDLFAATQRRDLVGSVVDITGVPELRRIEVRDAGIRIGAAATWSDLVRADLPPAFDMLRQAAVEVGSVQIQNAATVVGNVCNASPAADGVPCLLALDTEVEITSATGGRRMPLGQFVTGVRQTDLQPGEMVTALWVPASAMSGASRFLKLGARRYLVISIAMVAARLTVEDGRIAQAAIAVGACSVVAVRLAQLESALVGLPADAALWRAAQDDLVLPALSPIDDIRADGPYRAHAAAELVRRALRDLTGEAR